MAGIERTPGTWPAHLLVVRCSTVRARALQHDLERRVIRRWLAGNDLMGK